MTESFNLISQKLVKPVFYKTMLHRPRLTKRLDGSTVSIVNITAHAGFGKTVLLSQLVEALHQPAVWYHLDAYDNDPAVFWRYLIAGFQKHHRDFGRDALSFINNNQQNANRSRTVLSMLVNELARFKHGVTVVFDDCHVISEPVVKSFMEDFLHHLPPRVKVLTAGRADSFQVNHLLISGEVLQFDAEDLCFTRKEITSHFSESGLKLADEELELIIKNTGGWPLAVSLYINAPAGKKFGVTEKNKDSLFTYMASEILAGEDEETRSFLTSISVLEEIIPEHCDLLLDRNDSQELLALLKRKCFFLTSFSDKADTYCYHQLFRDFLLEQLRDKRFALLEKAGEAACRLGNIERAVEYFIAAGAGEKARELIIQEGKKLMGRGDWYTVDRWLQNFSDRVINSNPWLILYKARIELNRGKFFAGENRVNHALNAFTSTGDRFGLAEARLLKAKILRCQGRYQDSLNLLKLAVPGLPPHETEERFDLTLEMSFTLILCGRFAEAKELLTGALELAEERGDSVLMTYFYEGLGNVYFCWGYPDRSLYYFRRGMAVSPDKTLRNYYLQDAVGPIYQDWGELDRAFEYLQSVTAKENFGLTEALPGAYYQLGNVLLDRGELQKAEEYFRKALDIIQDQGGDHFVLGANYLMLAACLEAQGRLVEAEAIMETARNLDRGQSEYLNSLFQAIETLFLLRTGNIDAAYPLLQQTLRMLKPIGARKPLCVVYSALALIGILRKNEKDISAYAGKALELAADMNYVHDFLMSYEIFQPLIYLGFERGMEVQFLQRIMVRLGEVTVPLLKRVAGHFDPSVRQRAVAPLVQIGGEKAMQILKNLLKDENQQVSETACRLLKKQEVFRAFTGDSACKEKELFRLELLGPTRIYSGEKEITHINWIRSKSRDLLIYLAHLGGPADKQKIIDALWPEMSSKQANALFHTTMHNLRQVLSNQCGLKELVLYRSGRYYLLPGSTFLDKQYFQELLAAVGHDSHLSKASVSLLEEAVSLYRGDYLEELDYTWVLPEQEYLKQLHNRARDRLSLYYLNKGDYPQAIIHFERLVQDNPLTEEYYHRLITTYAGIGDLKSINLQYYRLRSILKEELGLSPSKEIQNLYSRLINSR